MNALSEGGGRREEGGGGRGGGGESAKRTNTRPRQFCGGLRGFPYKSNTIKLEAGFTIMEKQLAAQRRLQKFGFRTYMHSRTHAHKYMHA